MRVLAGALVAALLMSVVAAVPASAAPTRHEAENATISQGLVESNHAGYSGAGFVNGDNVAGSYTEFTVTAAAAGQAEIAIRYANGTAVNRAADIAVNGTVVSAARAFNGTGAWSTWATSTLTAPVTAGANKIRITSTTANGNPNLDYVDVEVAAPSSDLQAEDATIVQGVVESNHAGFTGTGFVNYDNVVGSHVEFTVNAPTAGNYEVRFRFANGTTADRAMAITANGGAAQNVSFPGTGAWTTWVEKSVTASLIAGANKIRATATTANGGPNLDRISTTVPPDPEPPTAPGNLRVVGEVRPSAVDLAWDASTDNVGVSSYVIYNGGNVIKTVGGNQTTATVTGLTPNTGYVLSVLAYDAAGNGSPASNNVPFTTPPSDDHQAPTVPGNLRATNVAATSITLAWAASTDNVEVTGYNVYRDGTKFATVPDLTATADGLTQNTQYSFQVEAFDANGNISARSPALNVRTSTQATGGDPVFDRDVTQLDLPWGIAFLPDGSALVAERDRFEIVRVTATGQKTVVGKITEAVGTVGEGGLLGLALSPNFATDHYVYAYHTASGDNRVAGPVRGAGRRRREAGHEQGLAYWRDRLADLPPTAGADRSPAGAVVRFALPPQLVARVRALARDAEATPFMVLLAAFAQMVQRRTGQDDLLVATPAADRDQAEWEGLIGYFVNLVPLRIKVSTDFRELLSRVREDVLADLAHRDVPFPLIAEHVPRASGVPLAFEMHRHHPRPLRLGEAEGSRELLPTGAAKFDMIWQVTDDGERLFGVVEFSTDLYDPAEVETMVADWESGLTGAVQPLAHEVFEWRVGVCPDAVAVV
ncbi:condensation domain-containing protein, partial [Nonomuraea sp. NPDC055795]